MKAFKCDGNLVCCKCYLKLMIATPYPNLVLMNSKTMNIKNDEKCEWCNELCSNQDSLNAIKHLVTILDTMEKDLNV